MITREHVKKWHILAVDDHPDSLEVLMLTMMACGAEVTTATNGKLALEVLKPLRPTIVLMDLSMPELDGWGALHAIRNDGNYAHVADVPVIAVTAHAMDGDREMVLNAGFDHYISKPFSPMTLVDDLLAVINTSDTLITRIETSMARS